MLTTTRPRVRRLSLLSAILLLLISLGVVTSSTSASASITNTRVDAVGTLELSGNSWLKGSGVDVYSNGVSPLSTYGDNYVNPPSGSAIYSGYKWQCVELVNRLYISKGWIGARWTGNGGDMYSTAPAGMTRYAQGSISSIVPGDVIVLQDSSVGHVAIVNSVSAPNASGNRTVSTVSQNTNSVFYDATLNGGTLTWVGMTTVGVVHSPANHFVNDDGLAYPLSGNFSGDGKQDFAYATRRSDGGTDIAVWRSNGSSGMTWQGAWLTASGIPFDAVTFIPADYDGDGLTDLYCATPRSGGIDVALLRNTGTAFTYVGLQWSPSGLNLGTTKLISGNFSGDSKGDFAYVTPRSDGGSDIAIWQSNGSSGMTWQGVWLQSSGVPFDSVRLIPADYDGDGLTDLYYATPKSGGGFDLALLRSTGSGFSYQGQQWNPSSPNLDSIEFIPGNFSGDAKGDFAYVTPKSGGGSEIAVWRSSGSSGMTWQGVWISTSSIPFGTTSYVPADYDGDGLTDLYYVTPTSTGFDMALLGDSGTSLGYVGLQWQANLPLATTRFIPQG